MKDWILKMFKRLFKCFVYASATFIIGAAVFLGAARALTPYLSDHKARLEMFASTLLGQPVQIAKVSASWLGFEPVFRFSDVTLLSRIQKSPLLHAHEVQVGINIINSLWHWRLTRGLYVVSGVKLRLQEPIKGWGYLLHYQLSKEKTAKPNTMSHIFDWLFSQDEIMLRRIDLQLMNNDDSVIPLSNIQVVLKNDGQRHEISGFTALKQTIASHAAFVGIFNGDDEHPKKWYGKIYVNARDIVLPQWVKHWRHPEWKISSGQITGEAWLKFANSELVRIQTRFKGKHINLLGAKYPLNQLIQTLSGHVAWLRERSGWEWRGDNINIKMKGHTWPATNFVFQRKKTKKGRKNTLFLNHLRINDVLPYILAEIPSKWHETINKLQPSGDLAEVAVNWQSKNKWELQTAFQKLVIHHWKKIPGVGLLNGSLQMTPKKVHAFIETQKINITYPKLFRHGITGSSLKVDITAKPDKKDGWQLLLPNIYFNNRDFSLNAKALVHIPKNIKNTSMELSSFIEPYNILHLADYFPLNHTSAKLRHWLDTAFKQAQVRAKLIFQGKFRDFPFENTPGQFLIDLLANDVTMKFKPDWPLLKNMNASIEIKNRTLSAQASKGTILGIPVNGFTVKIPHLGDNLEVLHIKGDTLTNVKKIQTLIANSPLKKAYGFVEKLMLRGPVKTQLHLQIPFHDTDKNLKVEGQLNFINSILSLRDMGITLKNLKGYLYFTRRDFKSSDLKGNLFQHDVKLSLSTLKNKSLQIYVDGLVSITRINKLIHFKLSQFIKGIIPYHAKLIFSGKEYLLSSMNIDTPLTGGAISLPKPLGKLSSKPMKTHLRLDFTPNTLQLLIQSYKNTTAKLWFEKKNKQYNLESAHVQFGKLKKWRRIEKGLIVTGRLVRANLKEWWNYWDAYLAKNKTGTILIKLKKLYLKIGRLDCFGNNFRKIGVAAALNDNSWDLDLSGPDVIGVINYSFKPNYKIMANLSRLYLHPNKTKRERKTELTPKSIPSLNINIQDFQYEKKLIGQFRLVASHKPNKLIINQLAAWQSNYQLDAAGEWSLSKKTNKTFLEGQFKSKKLASFLKSWKISPAIDSRNAKAYFNLNWFKGPLDFTLHKLNGTVNLMLKDGRITHLSKETQAKVGLGKLLSILSLQTIPRRLTLNFRDLSSKGFAFDTLKGTFRLKHGNAITKNTTFDGPVAFASVQGHIGLGKENYDLLVKVVPHITASLPIIATIAGGPIAGVVTWVVNKVVTNKMKIISSYTYRILGPWKKPKVIQVKITRPHQVRKRR